MRCPKCNYIGFEEGDRCRNCGYEFSLVQEPNEEEPGRRERDGSELDFPRRSPGRPVDLNRIIGAPPTRQTPDLPLFHESGESEEDLPLVSPSSTPRPPLAVRRPAPQSPRLRPRAEPSKERDPDVVEEKNAFWEPSWHAEPEPPKSLEAAALGPRLVAAAIDLLLIASIDTGVVYFTLRLCRLSLAELWILPVLPMMAFFLLLNGGYLASFTAAGGQTIGKMAVGIRVVGHGGRSVEFARALLRTLAYLPSVLPAGLGFIPAFFDEDRRALHDRLTDTRVIRRSPAS